MKLEGRAAIKVIIAGGAATFLFLWLVSFGLDRSLQPDPSERAAHRSPQSPFDGERAYRDLEQLVACGPRLPGSDAARAARRHIKHEAAAAGLKLRSYPFTADSPAGPREMVNLVAEVKGTRPGIILLGAQYDTREASGTVLPGANDGGAAAAWLLEMARALGPSRQGHTVHLVWFDGTEVLGAADLHGSRYHVSRLQAEGRLDALHCVIHVAMIGDCYLRLFRDPEAPAWLRERIQASALRLGYQKHLGTVVFEGRDNHLPFREAGVPTLQLIDFSYGGSLLEHQRYWHSPEDNLDKVCPESLQAVGDVLYHALQDIDAQPGPAARRPS